MNRPEEIQEELESAFSQYDRKVQEIANRIFEIRIKPWLKASNYCFAAGNGTFVVYDNDLGIVRGYVDTELYPQIDQILNLEVPGFPGNSFGSLMPDFYPKKRGG
jgi:hypothetical protein